MLQEATNAREWKVLRCTEVCEYKCDQPAYHECVSPLTKNLFLYTVEQKQSQWLRVGLNGGHGYGT